MDKDIKLNGQWECQCENAELQCGSEIALLSVNKQGGAASPWKMSGFPRFRVRGRQEWLSHAVTWERGQSPHPMQHRPMKLAVDIGLRVGWGLISFVLTEFGINVEFGGCLVCVLVR